MIFEKSGVFCIETEDTGMYIAPRGPLAEQLHYGRKIEPSAEALRQPLAVAYGTDVIYDKAFNPALSLLHLGLEVSPTEKGDFRRGALALTLANGSPVCDLRFAGGEVLPVPPEAPGLPAARDAGQCLVLRFESGEGMAAELFYIPLDDCDVIVRQTRLTNRTGGPVTLRRAMSYQLDLPRQDLALTTLTGAWAREFEPCTAPVRRGLTQFGSTSGTSGHYCNPFFALSAPDANEHAGEIYGFNLLYSGSHAASVEADSYGFTRVMAGIQPEGFSWTLEDGESFVTPQAALTFSARGRNGLRHNMHRFVRRHILPPRWKDAPRPVLVNNWEATYFDFTPEKLVAIAKDAKELGIEMLVMDDGWFGKRDSDYSGLGDWFVNEKKLKGGLKNLVEEVNKAGMKFGIWFEPEMISEDSDLYRAHPDWALTVPGRSFTRARHQLVLDFSREDVRTYIFDRMCEILESANIEYVKWDANRHLTDVWSAKLPADRQGEVFHRYILGLYDFLEKLTQRFPNLLIEGCSGGGGRFDAGMMYYHPQIWCSDDTDAIERLDIQYGTSFGYPISTVGSHVSVCPNHQTGRSVSMKTRGIVAMAGTFGYELDITRLSQEEKDMVKIQVEEFKKYYSLIQQGDYYRLTDDGRKSPYVAWEFAAEDGTEALLNVVTLRVRAYAMPYTVRINGLKPEAVYEVEGTGEKYSGAALINGGYLLPVIWDDYQSVQVHFVECCE